MEILKKLLNTNSNNRINDFILLFLRIAPSLLLLTHGYPKLLKLFSGGEIQFPQVMGMSSEISLFLAMFAEFFCSIFVILGLFTRFAAFPIVMTFLIIVFLVHGADDLSMRELPFLYLISYITVLFLGAGKFSIDNFIYNKIKK